MPGSGKTTLAEKVFQDQTVLRCFDHRAWVTVGRKYEFNVIARRILAQLDPDINEITQGDDRIGEKLKERLKSKRCLIVLDNIWDTEVLDYIKTFLPNKNNAMIRILLNTNLYNVAQHIDYWPYSMWPLNEKESEDLLREKVFGDEKEYFPPQLEKAAKKIAKNCNGLPLMIVTVAHLLSKAMKNDDPEVWNEVAENRNSVVMMDAHNQISKVLFPVYDCCPQSLKMFYLYMGAFPQDSEIPASKLIIMLTAEGFLQRPTLVKLEKLAVLKLQCYAFQGPKWEIKENEHFDLGFLQIEDTDLVEWKVARGGLPWIRQLSIKHCYNFEELNWEPDNYSITKIEVVDCNPSLVARVNQIEEAQLTRRYPYLGVSLHFSWDDGNLESTPTLNAAGKRHFGIGLPEIFGRQWIQNQT